MTLWHILFVVEGLGKSNLTKVKSHFIIKDYFSMDLKTFGIMVSIVNGLGNQGSILGRVIPKTPKYCTLCLFT